MSSEGCSHIKRSDDRPQLYAHHYIRHHALVRRPGRHALVFRSVVSNDRSPPSATAIRQIEFELEKAERGMAMPYDAERVMQ